MAESIRLKSTNRSSENRLRIVLCVEGSFGRSVANDLESYGFEVSDVYIDGATRATEIPFASGDVVVLISSKPLPSLCSDLDRIASSGAFIFLALTLYGNYIQVGPLVRRCCECCWTCFQTRLTHQRGESDVRKATTNYYEDSEATGPQGFLRSFSLLSAARLAQVLCDLDLTTNRDEVWQLSLDTGTTEIGSPLGLHGCSRCGMQRVEETRTIDPLSSVVSHQVID